jgi:hypothetical protein
MKRIPKQDKGVKYVEKLTMWDILDILDKGGCLVERKIICPKLTQCTLVDGSDRVIRCERNKEKTIFLLKITKLIVWLYSIPLVVYGEKSIWDISTAGKWLLKIKRAIFKKLRFRKTRIRK